jgi:hypothetical protein
MKKTFGLIIVSESSNNDGELGLATIRKARESSPPSPRKVVSVEHASTLRVNRKDGKLLYAHMMELSEENCD